MKLCSVLKCLNTKIIKRHRFPNPYKYNERFKIWLERTGNPNLGKLDPTKIYKNGYFLCDVHFKETDFGPNQKLKNTAIPTIQIMHGKYLCASECHR